jgi:nitrogen fixation NifU-like protein
MDNLYSEKVMDHFKNPRNLGEIEDADGVGTVGNPNCGDVMKIYIKVKNDKVDDIKFQTLGCGAAIASSSIATELVKGKSIKEALKLTSKEIAEQMGKFPPAKYHCSILAEEGIKKAIEDYKKKK